jgi:hypothetical protein
MSGCVSADDPAFGEPRFKTLAVPVPSEVVPEKGPQNILQAVCSPPTVLFLSMEGERLFGNNDCDNARTNCTHIVSSGLGSGASVLFPAYAGSAAEREQTIRLVREYYAPFNVLVVTTRPTAGAYMMTVVGGRATDVGIDQSTVAGVAPLDCGNRNDYDISFAFSAGIGNDPHAVAITIAQESAHALGLGHVQDERSLMYPYLSALQSAFQDRSMTVVNDDSDCSGTGIQNDRSRLIAIVGPACTEGADGGAPSGSTPTPPTQDAGAPPTDPAGEQEPETTTGNGVTNPPMAGGAEHLTGGCAIAMPRSATADTALVILLSLFALARRPRGRY